MIEFSEYLHNFPNHQEDIWKKCIHPTGTFIEYRKEEIEQSIPDRFEQQVLRHPERIAIKSRENELTYEELNRTANGLAEMILTESYRHNKPIAIFLEHGAPVIIGILGILKAGRTYVPLDPWYPIVRTKHMIADSQTGLIVTNTKNLSTAMSLVKNDIPLINIDDLDQGMSGENLGLSISPDTMVYILYTSGSTGKPKGVPQTHRNVLHEIMNYTNIAHICREDRMLLISSCSFGDAVRTIYGALLNGAGLYSLDIKKDGLYQLEDWISEHKVTIYRSVATAFRHFAGGLRDDTEFPHVRLVYLAGEPVCREHVELFKRYFPKDCIFINGLGSIETFTYRWFLIDIETPIKERNVPVGYMVQDKDVLLVGDDGKEVEEGKIGEIAVKSRYITAGYWKSPQITQEKFLQQAEGTSESIYLTGDIGRMLPDGCLVYLGRKDFQVKVRGYRIEIAEIEMALMELESVKEAAVIANADPFGDKKLTAYFVPARKPPATISELSQCLAEKLPEFMIPSVFVQLDELPLNPNGKIDRLSLPKPSRQRPELLSPFTPPRTATEQTLSNIWSEILDIKPIGINDKFLELGGNSIMAMKIISRILNTFQLKLIPSVFFKTPTIAEMANMINENSTRLVDSQDPLRKMADFESRPIHSAKEKLKMGSKSRGNFHG